MVVAADLYVANQESTDLINEARMEMEEAPLATLHGSRCILPPSASYS